MKSWVLNGIDDIGLVEIEKPALKKGEVLVRVKAAGICGSDIPRIYQTGAHTHPLTPGHEFSGIVEALGENADSRWLGKRVGIFPLIPCGKCTPCMNRRYEMCRNYSYLGSRRDGGFAEYVAVPQKNLIELPENVTYEEAAMLEPMAVAAHAMRRSKPEKSQTVVVYGLGTIGLLLIMLLKDAGIENILAVGNKDAQKFAVNDMGILPEKYCDSREKSPSKWIMEQTNGAGADVLFECIGKNAIVSDVIDAAAPGGEVVLVGNPASDMQIEKNIYWKILRNQLDVKGTWNSSFTGETEDDWHYVLERLQSKKVMPEHLITHKLALSELERGLHIMKEKKEDYVKIMCVL